MRWRGGRRGRREEGGEGCKDARGRAGRAGRAHSSSSVSSYSSLSALHPRLTKCAEGLPLSHVSFDGRVRRFCTTEGQGPWPRCVTLLELLTDGLRYSTRRDSTSTTSTRLQRPRLDISDLDSTSTTSPRLDHFNSTRRPLNPPLRRTPLSAAYNTEQIPSNLSLLPPPLLPSISTSLCLARLRAYRFPGISSASSTSPGGERASSRKLLAVHIQTEPGFPGDGCERKDSLRLITVHHASEISWDVVGNRILQA